MLNKLVAVLGSPMAHRVAAAVVVALVGVQGFISVHGVDFGLDQNSVQTVVAVVGGLVVVAREFVNPVFLPFVLAIFKSNATPPPAQSSTPPAVPPTTPPPA